MFAEELKRGTLHAHTGVEKKLVTQIRKVSTIDDYIQLLELMYGYYLPLQQKIMPFLDNSDDDSRGRQAESILNDINDLKPDHQLRTEVCNNLPEVNTRAASLGALYVTEGSTLGGKYIAAMISKQLNISSQRGFSFFNAYGDQTMTMWEDFKSILNANYTDLEKREMMNSANDTFSKFNEWITLYESTDN